MRISFDLQKSKWPREEWLPLKWLMSLEDLELIPKLDGATEFFFVQPSELKEPQDFLADGSIVLTVGLAFENNPADLHDYVRTIAEAGAVGIGFGTGFSFPHVPEEVLESAATYGLSVFEVPRHIAFLSILNAVQDERLRRSRRQQERLLDIQERLNAAAIHGGLQTLIPAASSFLSAAIAIADNDGRIVSNHSYRDIDAAEFARKISLSPEPHSSADSEAGQFRINYRMEQQGERHHLMSVISDHPFQAHERSIVKHCAGLADILLQRPIYLRQARTELNTLALSLLLHIDSNNQAMDRVLDSASDASGRIRPVIIHADRTHSLDRALKEFDKRLAGRARYLFALDTSSQSRLVLVRGSRTVEDVISNFGSAQAGIRIAVGEPVHWRELTMKRIQELEVSAKTIPLGEALGPYEAGAGWLHEKAVKRALDRRAGETVDRLQIYDFEKGTDLAHTLEAFLRSGGALAQAANLLGIHRHTMRTRIAQIADICEVDLSDPLTRAELLLVVVTRVDQ